MSADYHYRVHDLFSGLYLEGVYRHFDQAQEEAKLLNYAETVLGGKGYRFAPVMTTATPATVTCKTTTA